MGRARGARVDGFPARPLPLWPLPCKARKGERERRRQERSRFRLVRAYHLRPVIGGLDGEPARLAEPPPSVADTRQSPKFWRGPGALVTLRLTLGCRPRHSRSTHTGRRCCNRSNRRSCRLPCGRRSPKSPRFRTAWECSASSTPQGRSPRPWRTARERTGSARRRYCRSAKPRRTCTLCQRRTPSRRCIGQRSPRTSPPRHRRAPGTDPRPKACASSARAGRTRRPPPSRVPIRPGRSIRSRR